ncbi:MAG: hypothetical protein GF344_10290 [Chitinivibrionales bacterium]|nr:hypothetical protein [Chitinivibrionales bacterium]MBD3357216.1 hypothetical protein [Chitinivibrionales bacterium]
MRLAYSFIALQFLVRGVLPATGGDPYSNTNRSLFVLPSFSALAGSALAHSYDGSAMSNPANLSLDSSREISVSYAGHYLNTFSSSVISYATPIGRGSGIGVSLAYLHLPDIEDTRGLETEDVLHDSLPWPVYDNTRIRMESMSEVMVNVAYGRAFDLRPGIKLAVGGAVHALRRRLIEVMGYGIGLDLGTTLEFERPGIRFSLLMEDVTTNYLYWNSKYKDFGPPHVRLGIGWRRELPYIYGKLTLSYRTPDLLGNEGVTGVEVHGTERDTEPVSESFTQSRGALLFRGGYGLEYVVSEVLALRVGYDIGIMRPSFGGGLNLFSRALSFDFSYLMSDLAGTYQVGATWRW